MSKSSKKKAKQQREAERDAFLRQLSNLHGIHPLPRDVFGRRAALPSEIAHTLQNGQQPKSPQ